jgi:hypothetical protein
MKLPFSLGSIATAIASCTGIPVCLGEVTVGIGHSASDTAFKLSPAPRPATNDAATGAVFTLVDGQRDRNGAGLAALNDGRVPWDADEPSKNFFFNNGTNGGRIQIDCGKPLSVQAVNTYSWHPRARGPQVYKLFAATGDEKDFKHAPKREIDPKSCGWKLVATVDTRGKGEGGQHAVTITNSGGNPLGEFRYLLLDVETPNPRNPQSNTFFSEIDVIESNGPAPVAAPERSLSTHMAGDGAFKISVDASLAPDLRDWVEKELLPVVCDWYPKLVAMLPSEGYTAPANVVIEFRDDMGGTPAYAAGSKVSLNAPWFRTQLKGEAKGCVIHELVHVVQNYGRARATNPRPAQTPGWVTEGMADYIRWFLFEPQSKGAEITRGNFSRSNYDSSYRVSANFLNWVVATHDKDFIRKLNAAAREGNYSEKVWTDSTGKTAEQLGADWKAANSKRLGL